MTMKTSCISPAVVEPWAELLDRVDDEAVRVGGVQLETACAIWSLLDPKWGSVTRVLPPGVV